MFLSMSGDVDEGDDHPRQIGLRLAGRNPANIPGTVRNLDLPCPGDLIGQNRSRIREKILVVGILPKIAERPADIGGHQVEDALNILCVEPDCKPLVQDQDRDVVALEYILKDIYGGTAFLKGFLQFVDQRRNTLRGRSCLPVRILGECTVSPRFNCLEMSLAERQSRWQQSVDAINGSTAIGWGRSFVAGLIRTAAPKRSIAVAGPTIPPSARSGNGITRVF